MPIQRVLLCALVVLAWAGMASSYSAGSEIGGARRHGLGVILFEPTGITGKHYLARQRHAIDWALGVGFIDGSAFHLHSDYLWEFDRLNNSPDFDLRWYLGAGARLRIRDGHHGNRDRDDFDLGPRGLGGWPFSCPGRRLNFSASWPSE